MTREREDTKKILEEVLEKISLLLAPFAPYISEYIYSNFGKTSVHLSSWPKANEKLINEKLEKDFENIFMIIEKGLAARDKAGIGLKWPLNKVIIKGLGIREDLQELVKRQLNVKKIELKKGKEIEVSFDISLTPELEAEGYARELSRQVQAFRKDLGLNKKDKIELFIITDDKFKKTLEKQKKFIKERTNSKKLEIVTTHKERFKKKINFKIKDKRGEIVIIDY